MFCPNCGNTLPENSRFCTACGASLESGASAPYSGGVNVKNLTDNPNIIKINELGCFQVFEHQKDMSTNPSAAITAYFMQEMNLRKRQVLCSLNGNSVKLQAGAMQWTAGKISMTSGVKGVKDFFGKALKGAVTNESTAKPVFSGNGYLMLEPTYKYIILENVADWGSGIVLDDGLFLACDSTVQEEVVSRSNFSSAVLGGEGLFNLSLSGQGIAVLESAVPREELIEIELNNDEVRIDGNMAIAWSKSLQFTVERSSKSLVGSLVSGEGLVNIYRGTGKILMAPTTFGTHMKQNNSAKEPAKTSSAGSFVGSMVGSLLDL